MPSLWRLTAVSSLIGLSTTCYLICSDHWKSSTFLLFYLFLLWKGLTLRDWLADILHWLKCHMRILHAVCHALCHLALRKHLPDAAPALKRARWNSNLWSIPSYLLHWLSHHCIFDPHLLQADGFLSTWGLALYSKLYIALPPCSQNNPRHREGSPVVPGALNSHSTNDLQQAYWNGQHLQPGILLPSAPGVYPNFGVIPISVRWGQHLLLFCRIFLLQSCITLWPKLPSYFLNLNAGTTSMLPHCLPLSL